MPISRAAIVQPYCVIQFMAALQLGPKQIALLVNALGKPEMILRSELLASCFAAAPGAGILCGFPFEKAVVDIRRILTAGAGIAKAGLRKLADPRLCAFVQCGWSDYAVVEGVRPTGGNLPIVACRPAKVGQRTPDTQVVEVEVKGMIHGSPEIKIDNTGTAFGRNGV
jgi:hypothetical protein